MVQVYPSVDDKGKDGQGLEGISNDSRDSHGVWAGRGKREKWHKDK